MRRVPAIALVCLHTGCRVKEVLGLRFNDVDLMKWLGKGRRELLVPFSPELREGKAEWSAFYSLTPASWAPVDYLIDDNLDLP